MKRILVVDDERAITDVLEDFLSWEGYEVLTARSGSMALEQLPEALPDLILCDIMMPGMGGVELCRILQTDVTYREIPFVLMSAAGERVPPDRPQYAAFVAKPFNFPLLLSTISRLVGDES